MIDKQNNSSKQVRKTTILEVKSIESLDTTDEGIELNEGYDFIMNGSIPQIADGIAKLAVEMDAQADFGTNGGAAFVELIHQYYTKAKGGSIQ